MGTLGFPITAGVLHILDPYTSMIIHASEIPKLAQLIPESQGLVVALPSY